MPWFKVDDQLHSHPKSRSAGLAAMGLWTLCGAHAMAYKTDGFVPRWFVVSFTNGSRHANQLVKAGLWEQVENDGWQFHDWADFQPSSEEIERDRNAARERQRRSRERRRNAIKEARNEV